MYDTRTTEKIVDPNWSNNDQTSDKGISNNQMLLEFKQYLDGNIINQDTPVFRHIMQFCEENGINYYIDLVNKQCSFKRGSSHIAIPLGAFEREYGRCVFRDGEYPDYEDIRKVTQVAQNTIDSINNGMRGLLDLCDTNEGPVFERHIKLAKDFVKRMKVLRDDLMDMLGAYTEGEQV